MQWYVIRMYPPDELGVTFSPNGNFIYIGDTGIAEVSLLNQEER